MSKRKPHKPDGTSLIISVEQAAQLLGVTRRQVYSMVAHRTLPSELVVRVGRGILLLRPRLLQWAGLHNSEDPRRA